MTIKDEDLFHNYVNTEIIKDEDIKYFYNNEYIKSVIKTSENFNKKVYCNYVGGYHIEDNNTIVKYINERIENE